MRGAILGATSGVGRAVMDVRRKSGDALLGLGRSAAKHSSEEPAPGQVTWAAVDIRDYESLAAALQEAGPLDYLINCVGVGFYAPVGSDNTAAWQETLDTNLRGLFNIASIVRSHLPDLKDFIHISSLAAHRLSETPGSLAYSITKAGGRTIVQELRRELRSEGRSTRISMISPGFVDGTSFGDNYYSFRDPGDARPGLFDAFQSLEPSDVANTVDYALGLPRHMEILDLQVVPTAQPR